MSPPGPTCRSRSPAGGGDHGRQLGSYSPDWFACYLKCYLTATSRRQSLSEQRDMSRRINLTDTQRTRIMRLRIRRLQVRLLWGVLLILQDALSPGVRVTL